MTSTYRTALIVGAGTGLSASLARLFAAKACRSRSPRARSTSSTRSTAETGARAFACDAAKRGDVEKLFAEVEASVGAPDVVVYNASGRVRGPFVDLDPADVERAIEVTAFGGFLVAQQAARRMLPKGHGAILFTGASASVKGYPQSAPFAMGKFALRGLAQTLARELSPQGIHVAHFVIDGGIRSGAGRARRQARRAARSGRHRGELSARAASAAQRLDVGDGAAALGGEFLAHRKVATGFSDKIMRKQINPSVLPSPA